MDIDVQRKSAAILRVIAEAGKPLGSTRIAEELRLHGIDLKERMVRYYLEEADRLGFTENLGRRGRNLTELGRRELASAVAVDRVGFISDRVDELAYNMTFDLQSRVGSVILNLSTIPETGLEKTKAIIKKVFDAGLGMGRLLVVAEAKSHLMGQNTIPARELALGTLCSVTLNGVFQANGIPVIARFGGLLEIQDKRPVRFTQIINYNGTTIDPIEIFIKGKMTQVSNTAYFGNGTIGASFREIPAGALPKARQLIQELERVGLGGVLVIGEPGRTILDVPVSPSRVGLVIAAGLNPIAAIEEEGIPTRNFAMDTLCDYKEFIPASEL